jgi:hypothetical protein
MIAEIDFGKMDPTNRALFMAIPQQHSAHTGPEKVLKLAGNAGSVKAEWPARGGECRVESITCVPVHGE